MLSDLRTEFMLDDDIHYLNHGSFGACPREVFQDFQEWQRILERNPLDYFTRQLKGLFAREASGPLENARNQLAGFVGADAEGLIFMPNVTVALNAIAQSLLLAPGDEVLTTDHEYGTIIATWKRKCQQSRSTLIQVPVDLPVGSQDDFIDYFWGRVTPRTKVILMSHITSATALKLPVEEICLRARQAGIITVIDGAHGVGQIPLDLHRLDADFYTSNCHKWMLTPKGTGFLHVHESQRQSFEPLVISWAEINRPSFALRHEMWGTRDMASFLCIPTAIAFHQKHEWWQRAGEARDLLLEQREEFAQSFGTELPCDDSWVPQIASVFLPSRVDIPMLWKFLWEEHRIEAMLTTWRQQPVLRLSFNAYNRPEELDLLRNSMLEYLQTRR